MITAYCFRSSNAHVVAAAIRMITGCKDAPPAAVHWHDSGTAFVHAVAAPPLATAYHIAPAHDGWVIAYPNVAGRAPFASALSRQARTIVISVVAEQREAWERGHPVLLPADVPSDLLDARYFSQQIQPPVLDWPQWLHVWSRSWQPVVFPSAAAD